MPNYDNFKLENMFTCLQQFSIITKPNDLTQQPIVKTGIFPWSHGVSVLAVFTVLRRVNKVSYKRHNTVPQVSLEQGTFDLKSSTQPLSHCSPLDDHENTA